MMRFRLGKIRFGVHALVLVMAGIGMMLGGRREMLVILLAMTAHEAGHLLMAKICGLCVDEMVLMPFGGTAHMPDLYNAPTGKLCAAALAGPGGNLLVCAAAALMGWMGWISYAATADLVRINGLLAFFNLLPALPLDGGRVLFACARKGFGTRRAADLTAFLGFALAGYLTFAGCRGIVQNGEWNLTLFLMAVFLITSTITEHRSILRGGSLSAVKALCRDTVLPTRAQVVAVDADAAAPSPEILRYFGNGATLFALIRNGAVETFLTAREMARRAIP